MLMCLSTSDVRSSVQDNMAVRYMNWATDLHRLHSCKGSPHLMRSTPKQPDWLQDTPQLEDSAIFDTILGSDVVYEVCLAALALSMMLTMPCVQLTV